MDIQAIILDLDGTALRSDKSISPATLAALQRCRQRGIVLAVATARAEAAAEKYLAQLAPDAVVSNGGALVRLGSKTVFTACLSAETADAIIAGITALPEYLEVTAQTPLGYYVSRPPADPDRSQAILHDFSKPLGQEAYKLTARASRADGLAAIAAKHPQCCLIPFSDGCWYRFAHKHATKPNAIRHLAACLNLDMAMFAAFGDDYNDEDMLRHCGIGIAMGNAAPQVKAAADYVCDTNDRDGIAKWLTEFVLKNTK